MLLALYSEKNLLAYTYVSAMLVWWNTVAKSLSANKFFRILIYKLCIYLSG